MRNLLIIVLAAGLALSCYRLVLVENQRYALLVGMCRNQSAPLLPDIQCLKTVETRTSWSWHLFYGLFGTLPG